MEEIVARIRGLAELPYSEADFTKYLSENVGHVKFTAVEQIVGFGCYPEEIEQAGSWSDSRAKTVNNIRAILEQISRYLEDEEMTNSVSVKWKKHLSKKKLSAHLQETIPAPDKNKTICLLKTCTKEFSNTANQCLSETFGSLLALKHNHKHAVVIKCSKKDPKTARVVHCFESTATKLLTIYWQVVLDYLWEDVKQSVKVALYITNIVWKKEDMLGSDRAEAVGEIANKFAVPQPPKSSETSPNKSKPEEVTSESDSVSELECSDMDLNVELEYSDEEREENSVFLFSPTDVTSTGRISRIFTKTSDLFNGESADKPSLQSTVSDSPTGTRHSVAVLSKPAKPLGDHKFLVNHILYHPSHLPSLGHVNTKFDNDMSMKYSPPLLLPGEAIQAQNTYDDIKHVYGEVVIGDKHAKQEKDAKSEGGKKKRSKWFGTNRLGGGGNARTKKAVAVSGRLYITNFQIIFVPLKAELPRVRARSAATMPAKEELSSQKGGSIGRSRKPEPVQPLGHVRVGSAALEEENSFEDLAEHVYIPFLNIYKIDFAAGQKFGEDTKVLEISCKDFRTIHFSFAAATTSAAEFVDILSIYFPTQERETFAFRFADSFLKTQMPDGNPRGNLKNGWYIYDSRKELNRILDKDPNWRISDVNKSYEMCNTYPATIAVPASFSDEDLMKVKDFRSRGRLPCLSWKHPKTRASITRCSQPKVGIKGSRSVEDEKLLLEIMYTNQTPDEKGSVSQPLYLMDARPRANAVANHAVGAGFEDTSRYKQTKLRFLNIANIHVMRDSLRKLHELCLPQASTSSFLSTLDASHWLDHINLILVSAVRIAKLISSGVNVLIHCSDGWDRTSQLSALAMLLMDPYYRTLEGFIVLIEKEWLGFGHKFRDRCGHLYPWVESETSPVFLQFLDTVWQVLLQFPGEFEFNSRLLIALADCLNSGQYGTFLCNCEKERVDLELSIATISFWTHVMENKSYYTQPSHYNPNKEALKSSCKCEFIKPSTSPKLTRLWVDLYLRYDRSVPKNMLYMEEQMWGWTKSLEMESLQKRNKDLKENLTKLQEQILELGFTPTESSNGTPIPAKDLTSDLKDDERRPRTASNVELNFERMLVKRLKAELEEEKKARERVTEEMEERIQQEVKDRLAALAEKS